jgi:hypothetical protein
MLLQVIDKKLSPVELFLKRAHAANVHHVNGKVIGQKVQVREDRVVFTTEIIK